MPFFDPASDPGSSFPELLRKVGLGSVIGASDGSPDLDVPHACSWTFETPEGTLVRTLRRPRGTAVATVSYAWAGSDAAVLCLRPLLPLRSMHEIGVGAGPDAVVKKRQLIVRRGAVSATLEHDGAGAWIDDPQWWRDFRYRHDANRGQGCVEDVPSPARVEIALPAASTARVSP